MNLLLNKIDTDIRRKLQEEIKNGKVHRKSNIRINKDSEKKRKKFFGEFLEEERKKEKGKITIKATKIKDGTITLDCEKDEFSSVIINGTFLDVKK